VEVHTVRVSTSTCSEHGAGGAVPASGWYQVLDIEVIAVLGLDMVDFSFNLVVEKVQFLQKTVILDFK
jgi:hypothetical protein